MNSTSWVVACVAGAACAVAQWPISAAQGSTPSQVLLARPCRAHGQVSSGDIALPGVSVTAKDGERVAGLTSTDLNGSYVLPLAPGTYVLHFEPTGFTPVDRTVTIGPPPCDTAIDVTSSLAPRGAVAGAAIPQTPPGVFGAGRGFGRGGRGGQGDDPSRFQVLPVQGSETAADVPSDVVLEGTAAATVDDAAAAALLPAGFSLNAPLESVAVSGTMVELDRNLLNDRIQALARGDFDLADGQVAVPLSGLLGAGPLGGAELQGGGRGGPLGGGPGGGLGGLGGRLGGANRLQASANYSLGGSLLNAAPYSLRGEAAQKRDYVQQTVSFTLGGALKIPGLYQNATNRTTFNFSYTGGRNNDLFDQYATVPSEAFRIGDFSASPVAIIDPVTGQQFPGNQIPADRISSAAQKLLEFIPSATLDGDTRNFHNIGTSVSNNDTVALRITHSFTNPQAGRGGRGGGAFGGGGRAGGRGQPPAQTGQTATANPAGNAPAANGAGGNQSAPAPVGSATAQPSTGANTQAAAGTTAAPNGGGPAPAAAAQAGGQGRGGFGAGRGGPGGRGNFQPPLSVTMNATINYRRNDGDRLNVFPALSGETKGSTFSMPVTLNVRQGRMVHNINTNFSRTTSTTLNDFAFTENVAGIAGIGGVATDPFDWGVPSLTFGSFTSVRDVTPSRRNDHSWQVAYGLTRPTGAHTFRAGGSFQQQVNKSQSDSNARGSFTFTGLYTAGGLGTVRGSGQDFADFLLGLPQQATRQYSETLDNIAAPITIRGRTVSAYFQDDWRWKARWTINYGLQYDFTAPYVETNGRMVNLDAPSDFTSVAAVQPGDTGPFSGQYPAGLVNSDANNIAPRIGVAWRATNRAVIRFGYGLSYNSGAYSNIARQLYQQPPFFLTGTSIGTLEDPLTLSDPFANISPSTLTNSYGIAKNYQLGLIHQWNADVTRDITRMWVGGVTYIGTSGGHLDMLRAPNRGPDGLRIEDVQSFTWQSSEGSSYMNGISLRLQRRQTRGVSGTASYTLGGARDNTTATGGSATVAQDDQNLDAEWARSSFDQRHQFSGSMNIELPWGANRIWLTQGGWLATLAGGWSATANVTWQSGSPLTARCSTCASDVARGSGGTLRANYTGAEIQMSNPTIDQFFNTAAFGIPEPGTFGNSARNVIVGPGSRQLNATFTRDIPLTAGRTLSLNVNANNLLNSVNYASIDTNVNSPTFGQVLSVRGMRTVRVNLRMRF